MSRKLIIAVDFDGTLCNSTTIGEPNNKLIKKLIKARSDGHKVILWTCREGDNLEEAVKWCEKKGLIFDKVNDNLDDIVWKPSRKVLADIYIDDRSVDPENFCNSDYFD